MFPGGIGFQEIVVIAVVAVILFGSRLPDVARSLGASYQQFRKGLSEIQSSLNTPDTSYRDQQHYGGLPDYSDSHDDYQDQQESAPNFEPPDEDD